MFDLGYEVMAPNPLRDKILEKAKKTTIAQFKIKGDIIYQEEMFTFKKCFVILDIFKDFGIGCCLPKDVEIDPIIIPLPHLPAPAMEAIIKWSRRHKDDPPITKEQLNHNLYNCTGELKDAFDFQLYETLDEETLFDLLLATKYLGIPEMRDTLSTYIAKCIVVAEEEEAKRIRKQDMEELERRKKKREEDAAAAAAREAEEKGAKAAEPKDQASAD